MSLITTSVLLPATATQVPRIKARYARTHWAE